MLLFFPFFRKFSQFLFQRIDIFARQGADADAVLRVWREAVCLTGFCYLSAFRIVLVISDDIADVFLVEQTDQLLFRRLQFSSGFRHEHRDIRLLQHFSGTLRSHFTEFPGIVDAGRVDDHDRTERQQLHGLMDRISRRSRNIRDK